MDFGAALSSLIKPQPQFSLSDPTTLLALANLKYPMNNFNLPSYAHSLIQPRQSMASGIPNFDLASIIAAAAATATASSSSHDSKLSNNLSSSLTTATNVSISNILEQHQQLNPPSTVTSPNTPSTPAGSLSQLPIPIPAQPTSPTQSSASASSISSGGSMSQSAQSSPTRHNGSTTPLFGGGYKRKLNGTPTRKPPKPIPDENKDQAYYERRKKNNDAAKRSRDARKMKEEQTASRASYLEQENLQLRTQFEMMKAELTKMQMQVMLLTNSTSTGSSAFQLPSLDKDSDVSVGDGPFITPESTPKKPKIEASESS